MKSKAVRDTKPRQAPPVAVVDRRSTAPVRSPSPVAASAISDVPGVVASAKLIELARGLYSISVGETKVNPQDLAGMAVPATHIASTPAATVDGIEIFAASAGAAGWLGPEGGTVAVRVPSQRGHLLITTYRFSDQMAVPLEIQITRLDRSPLAVLVPASARIAPSPDAVPSAPQAPAHDGVGTEIVLHIEGTGDRRYGGGDWIGNRGQKRRIEAFSVRPLEKLAPSDIEYKAYGANGRETPWVSDGRLCGTRGRGLPLTGFAIRVSPRLGDRYDVIYEGSFFHSGVAGPKRNGDACMPALVDDPLEAVNIRLVERPSP